MNDQLTTGQFNDSFKPVMDGVGVCVESYAHWLSAMLGPSYVITPRVPGHRDTSGSVVRYASLPLLVGQPYRLGVPALDSRLQRTIRAIPFDLVHAHCPFSSGQLALRLARSRRVPLVATFHTKYRDNLERYVPSRLVLDHAMNLLVTFFEQADQVWVPNHATGETLVEYGYRGRYQVVDNGSDFQATAADVARLGDMVNKRLGLLGDDPVYLYVGQHVWEKNLAFLIEALAKARRSGMRFQMLFVGDGYARPDMERMVSEAQLSDCVRFLGLVHDRQWLQALYARADLFLFPSLYDNAPLTVREAATMHTPAVLIDGCSAAEGVQHGYNGFLSENSVRGYVDLLTDLDRPLAHAVGQQAAMTLARTWQAIAQEVAERYRDLVQQRTHPRAFWYDRIIDRAETLLH